MFCLGSGLNPVAGCVLQPVHQELIHAKHGLSYLDELVRRCLLRGKLVFKTAMKTLPETLFLPAFGFGSVFRSAMLMELPAGVKGQVCHRRQGHIFHRVFRIGWRVDNGFKLVVTQIFYKFQPALNAGASARRPVIGNNQHSLHRQLQS